MKNLYDSSSTTTTITAAVAATEDDEDHDDHYDADAVVEKDAGDDGFQLAGLTVREVGNLFAAHDLGMYLQVLEANGVDGSILADPALCEQDLEVKTVTTGDIRNYPLPTGTRALLLFAVSTMCSENLPADVMLNLLSIDWVRALWLICVLALAGHGDEAVSLQESVQINRAVVGEWL